MELFSCQTRYINPAISTFCDNQLCLHICTNRGKFSFSLHSLKNKQLLALAHYEIHSLSESFGAIIAEIIKQDELLSFDYGKVYYSIDDFKSSLVPSRFFSKENTEDYLRLLYPLSGQEVFFKEEILKPKAFCLSAIASTYQKTILEYFPKAEFKSTYKLLIDNAQIVVKDNNKTIHQAFIHLRKNYFDILVYEHNELRFINSYPFRTDNDLLYYSLLLLTKLKTDLGAIHVHLSGYAKELDCMQILENHILTIEYCKAPTNLNLPTEIDYSAFFTQIYIA